MATKRTLPPSALQEILAALFGDRPHELSRPFEQWLTASKPFASFTQTYQQKIRKKIRTARNAEEIHNLYCELRTAYLLLQEPKFVVEYEPYGKQYGRSADFAVTFRTHTPFHVEVTRLRLSQQEQLYEPESDAANGSSAGDNAFLLHIESRRLVDVVCAKLGQLSPSTPNVLLIWVQSRLVREIDLAHLMLALKRRAEQRDTDLLARYGFRNPADFIRHYQRLSIVLVQSLQAQEAEHYPLVWSNNDAKHPLQPRVRNLLESLITTDNSPDFTAGGRTGGEED